VELAWHVRDGVLGIVGAISREQLVCHENRTLHLRHKVHDVHDVHRRAQEEPTAFNRAWAPADYSCYERIADLNKGPDISPPDALQYSHDEGALKVPDGSVGGRSGSSND
jgi:hypothetical protein